MDAQLKKYIGLSRQFRLGEPTRKTAAPLHAFIEELRADQPTPQTGSILADVYSLLRCYKTAYEIFSAVADAGNRKDVARLASMKALAQNHADTFAIKPLRIIAPAVKAALPVFKYCPHPLEAGIFKDDHAVECGCCDKTVSVYYEHPIYSVDSVDHLCPECIHNGAAAKKSNATFQSDLINNENITGDKTEEVLHRTPGYISWQDNHWPAHCDDYCAFIDYVGWPEIEEMNISAKLQNLSGSDEEWLREHMRNNGHVQGYLFQCLKCSTYCLLADCD